MTRPLHPVATETAEALVCEAPGHGASAAVVGVREADGSSSIVTRGHAGALDERGQPTTPVPLPADPVFDVGSVTKVAATTTLCMCLVDQGRLDLDSPVSRRLPGFTGGGKDAVTVRDLLEHQAGLWEWWPTYLDGARSAQDALSVVQALPLRYPARTGRHYSDLGFMLLGAVVAGEYGEALDAVARRLVFDPLGMHDTAYRPRGVAPTTDRVVPTSCGDWYERRMVETGAPYPVPRDPATFTGWRTHTLVGEVNDGNCWHAFGGVSGHAGLFTTVTDLLRLGGVLLRAHDGGGPWRAEVVREFFRPGRDRGQGLGFWIRHGSAGAVLHHAGFPGARFAVLPRRRRVVALLTNRLHTTGEPIAVDDAWDRLVQAAEAA